jgi:hypothetical protein
MRIRVAIYAAMLLVSASPSISQDAQDPSGAREIVEPLHLPLKGLPPDVVALYEEFKTECIDIVRNRLDALTLSYDLQFKLVPDSWQVQRSDGTIDTVSTEEFGTIQVDECIYQKSKGNPILYELMRPGHIEDLP